MKRQEMQKHKKAAQLCGKKVLNILTFLLYSADEGNFEKAAQIQPTDKHSCSLSPCEMETAYFDTFLITF